MKFKKISSLVFIGLFFAMTLSHLWPEQSFDSLRENREAANPPVLLVDEHLNTNFFTDFDAWFNDHFRFRNKMIELYRTGMYTLFHEFSDDVTVGKDEWLFFPTEVAALAENVLYTEEELQTIVRNQLEIYETCAENGVDYFVMIVPNKITIYPEFAPSYIEPNAATSKMDQVFQALAQTPIPIIDVRETLLQHKSEGVLFKQTDTHWNTLGAYYAYQEMITAIGSVGEPLPLSAFDVTRSTGEIGDLQQTTGISANQFQSQSVSYSFVPKQAYPYTQTTEGAVTQTIIENSTLPRAIIFGDSFFGELQPFVSNHFSSAFCCKTTLYNETLERMLPNDDASIVVNQIVERNLDWWLLS